MSKTINSLSAELKAIFGESFGKSEEAPRLEESVEEFLEAKRNKMPFSPKMKKAAKKAVARMPVLPPKPEKKAVPAKKAEPAKKAVPAKKAPPPVAKKSDKAADAKVTKSVGGGGGGGKQHHPFKRSPNLGLGPGTPGQPMGVGARHHDQVKCWNCSCGNIYNQGCKCVGTGKTDDCPKGRRKKISFKSGYHNAYNKKYHAWRAQKRRDGDSVTKRTSERGRAAKAK